MFSQCCLFRLSHGCCCQHKLFPAPTCARLHLLRLARDLPADSPPTCQIPGTKASRLYWMVVTVDLYSLLHSYITGTSILGSLSRWAIQRAYRGAAPAIRSVCIRWSSYALLLTYESQDLSLESMQTSGTSSTPDFMTSCTVSVQTLTGHQ